MHFQKVKLFIVCLFLFLFLAMKGEDPFLRAVGKALIARYVLFNNSFINNVEVRGCCSYPSLLGNFQVAIATTEKPMAKWVMV